MPAFDNETPRRDVEVLGLKLKLPETFTEGHTLTANEAKFVNDRLQSVMVNSYGGDLRRALAPINKARIEAHKKNEYEGPWAVDGEGKEVHPRVPAEAQPYELAGEAWADHQANFDKKFAAYQVGGVNGREAGVVTGDPVARAAREIAIREVKELLIKRGKKVKEAMDAKDPANDKRSMFQKYVEDRLNGPQRDRIFALAKVQMAEINDDDDQEFEDIPANEEPGEAGEKDAA